MYRTTARALAATVGAAALVVSATPAAQAQSPVDFALGSVSGSVAGIAGALQIPNGSASPGICAGFDPSIGMPAFVDSYLPGSGAPGFYIEAKIGSNSALDYTLDWRNLDTGRTGTDRGTLHGVPGFLVSAARWVQTPLEPGRYEWTLRDLGLRTQSILGPGPFAMSGCSGTWHVR